MPEDEVKMQDDRSSDVVDDVDMADGKCFRCWD